MTACVMLKPSVNSAKGKSLSTEKHKIFWARSGERAIRLIRIRRCATVPLGWWFLLSAEPDIHLLSETLKSPHRRLSLCSLPVPKQTDGSLGSCLRHSARDLRDLAACAPNDPDVLYFQAGFYAAAVPPSCSAGAKSCFLRSTASRWRPSSWLRQASPGSCSLSVAPPHKPAPAHGCIEEPVSRPPPALAECACSSASRWAFERACPPSFSPRYKVRNS
jgi:hypothetical protein